MKSRRLRRNSKRSTTRARQDKACDYQKLEPRQMLAVDVGVNFTSATLGTESTAFQPDIAADLSSDYLVQMINGNVSTFDKSGTLLASKTLDQFWVDAGATNVNGMHNPRVVYDIAQDRWFAVALNDGAGSANEIFIGWSDTGNPIGGWQSLQFVADSGGFKTANDLTLGVDAEGVFITANMTGGIQTSSIYAIPKPDLFAPMPSLLTMARYEGLSPAVHGRTIQFAIDVNDGTSGDAIGLGMFTTGSRITRTDIIDINGIGPFLGTPVDIPVPSYVQAPPARQPSGATLDNVSPVFSSNVALVDGYLWAVHTIRGPAASSAIRWYQIDASTNTVVNMGDIEHPDFDFLAPSIDVSETGIIAIGFTATGPTLNPSAFVAMGYQTYGKSGEPKVTMDFPSQLLQSGVGNYENPDGSGINRWGKYSSTAIDPADPFSVWSFQEYANTDNNWSVKVAESGLFALTPTLRGDNANNTIVVRRRAANPGWVDVVFDGVVTDTFEMSALDVLNIDAMGGNDQFILDLRNGQIDLGVGLTLRGGDGFDSLTVIDTTGHAFVLNNDGSGKIDSEHRFFNFEELRGTEGDDTFDVQHNNRNFIIRGLDGNDFFKTSSDVRARLDLYGGNGDDTYQLRLTTLTSGLVNIFDSINAENDRLNAEGTDGDDVFVIHNDQLKFNSQNINFVFAGIESTSLNGLGGNDEFNLQANTDQVNLFGNEGDDIFRISSDAPVNAGNMNLIRGEVFIDGGAGKNRLIASNAGAAGRAVTVTSDQIMGMSPGTIHYTADLGGFSVTNGLAGIELISGFGADNYDIVSMLPSNTLQVFGGDGKDLFTIRQATQGTVRVDGQEGGDTYRTAMGAGTQRFVFVNDTGTDTDFDRMTLTGTENGDFVTIDDEKILFQNEQIIYDEFIEVLIADVRGGDDQVSIRNNDTRFMRVYMGDGSDNAMVDEARGVTGIALFGNEGDDVFGLINSTAHTFLQAYGENGNDVFDVKGSSFAKSRLDGGEGDDRYDIEFAGRRVRRLDVRDTGAGGQDQLNVMGTSLIDRVDVNATTVVRAKEQVFYDGNTESLLVDTTDNNDIVEVFGSQSPLARILTRAGDDIVFVHATAQGDVFTIDTGLGADIFNVSRVTENTELNVFGQAGEDKFNIGSTLVADDGNLGRIRGRLRISGGAEADRLYVNDRAANAAYDYYMSDGAITNLNGGSSLARPAFSGIYYNSVEFSRLDGSDKRNFFSVMPSVNTRMYVDGNLPVAATLITPMTDGDYLHILGNPAVDGRQLFVTGPGQGVWTFADGKKDVGFENIEGTPGMVIVNPSAPQLMIASGSGSFSGPQMLMTPSESSLALAGAVQLSDQGDSDTGRSVNVNDTEEGYVDDLLDELDAVGV